MFAARKSLLIALDSVGIDPLGVSRPESVYFASQFLFPKDTEGPVQTLPAAPIPGLLTYTDVTDGQEVGGIECALTYTSIFSGKNAVRHHGLLRSLELNHALLEGAIRESNLFKLFRAPCLSNAVFPVHLPFFRGSYVEDLVPSYTREAVERGLRFRGEPVCLLGPKKCGLAELFTLAEINQNIFVFAAREAGLKLRTYQDVRESRALTATMTHELESEFNLDFFGEEALPILSPEEAAFVLTSLLSEHDFVFYKYQLPDLISHTGRLELARAVFAIIERFLAAILHSIEPETTTVVVTSDHGYLEQVSYFRGHPKTKVPTWCFSKDAAEQANGLGRPEGIFRLFADLATQTTRP